MNIQRWKGLIWFGALIVGGGFCYSFVDFLQRKDELSKEVPDGVLAAVLDGVVKPEEHKSDLVDINAMQRVFNRMDWTGKEKVKPVVPTPGAKPDVVPKDPIETLLKVLAIKVDTSKPERSVAYVKYTHAKLLAHNNVPEDAVLQPDERLPDPYQDAKVEAITPEGIVFVFDDAAREKEVVPAAPYQSQLRPDLGIVVVGAEGEILPQVQRQIQLASPDLPPWKPEQLTQIRKNEFQVGTQTIDDLNQDYSRILSRDLSFSTYKDPRTGEVEGLKITRVLPNSIPAQAGLTEGEVLKSINGHKVTSANDAIAFVKANVDSTSTWTAVFEKQGREFTRVYHSP